MPKTQERISPEIKETTLAFVSVLKIIRETRKEFDEKLKDLTAKLGKETFGLNERLRDELLLEIENLKEIEKSLKEFVRKAKEESVSQAEKKVEIGIDKFRPELKRSLDSFKSFLTEHKKEVNALLEDIRNETLSSASEVIGMRAERLASELKAEFKTLIKIKETPEETRDKLETLTGDERLDKKAIKGLEEFEKQIRTGKLPIGGTLGLKLIVGGIDRGWIRQLDFVGGDNVTISYTLTNGRPTLTINGGDASLWQPDGDDHIEPKDSKLVKVENLDIDTDVLPATDKTINIGRVSGETPLRFKNIFTYDPHLFSDFFSTTDAGRFGFSTTAAIGSTIGIKEDIANGILIRGRTTTGNIQDIGARMWHKDNDGVFYSRLRFDSVADVERIWGFRANAGTDISDTQGVFFAQLTGETNIRAICRDGSGTTNQDTGIAVADLTFYDFKIELDDSEVRFYINDNLVNTISANIPSGFYSWIYRTETGANGTKTFEIDYAGLYQTR